MALAQPARDPAAETPVLRLLTRIDAYAIITLVVAHVIHMSGIFDGLVPITKQVALVVEYAIVLGYIAVAAYRGHVKILACAVAFAGYLAWQIALFASLAGTFANYNVALALGTPLLFVPFYESRLPLGTLLQTIAYTCCAYVVIYVGLQPLLMSHPDEGGRLVLLADGIRDQRVFLAAPFATFVLFAGVQQARQRPVIGGAFIAVAAAAIYLAHSRMAQAILAMIIVAAVIGLFFPFTRRIAALLIAIVFATLALLTVRGYFDPSWNPYIWLSDDSSAMARVLQYQDAVRAFRDNLTFGVGIAGSSQELWSFVKPQRPFFPSDLGTAGIFFQFGLIGFALFCIASIACIMALPALSVRSTTNSWALYYATAATAFSGFYAAGIITIGGMFTALTFALWLKGGYFSSRRMIAGSRFSEIDPTALGLTAGPNNPFAIIRRVRRS